MMSRLRYATALVLSFLLLFGTFSSSIASAADQTTKYRVYQNDKLLMEFSDYNKAVSYAKLWANSHVEEIGSRKWLWDNFKRYRVEQFGNPKLALEFHTYAEAVAAAKKLGRFASVRDMQGSGWVWHNYPRYQLYQGEIQLDTWFFQTLAEAQQEAKKWANAHVIDLATNRWVWDNISDAKEKELRQGPKIYQVYQGNYTREEWKFAYLKDAVQEALKWANSHIVNIQKNNKIVFTNFKEYKVHQNGKFLKEFVSLDEAIQYAKLWAHATIVRNGQEIWNNYPYYQVYQDQPVGGDSAKRVRKLIGEFHTIPQALAYAMKYSHASIKTYHGRNIWDNFPRLIYMGWTGTHHEGTILDQVSNTVGLDIVSPTWFILADAQGNISDKSSVSTAKALKAQGLSIHPLVSNQFNKDLTRAFLNSTQAQEKFIKTLIDRCVKLGVDGINIDFESLYGSDRNKFTAFVKKLADAAHAKKLKVSIDLIRGSIDWNHLTAFDHAELAKIVDYVIMMGYDQHWSGSTVPGSVAGLDWTEQGVREFLSYGIRRDQLILGVPFYVREWKIDSSGKLVSNRALVIKNLPELIKEKNAVKTWDPRFGQYKVEYKENGYKYVFWLEDKNTLKKRLEIVKKHQLAGIAAWRLGYEDREVWESILGEK